MVHCATLQLKTLFSPKAVLQLPRLVYADPKALQGPRPRKGRATHKQARRAQEDKSRTSLQSCTCVSDDLVLKYMYNVSKMDYTTL